VSRYKLKYSEYCSVVPSPLLPRWHHVDDISVVVVSVGVGVIIAGNIEANLKYGEMLTKL
jgi:hypothetical protein